jgi:hypothetical protein
MEKGKERTNGEGKIPKTRKKTGYFPRAVTNFVIGLIGRCGY